MTKNVIPYTAENSKFWPASLRVVYYFLPETLLKKLHLVEVPCHYPALEGGDEHAVADYIAARDTLPEVSLVL